MATASGVRERAAAWKAKLLGRSSDRLARLANVAGRSHSPAETLDTLPEVEAPTFPRASTKSVAASLAATPPVDGAPSSLTIPRLVTRFLNSAAPAAVESSTREKNGTASPSSTTTFRPRNRIPSQVSFGSLNSLTLSAGALPVRAASFDSSRPSLVTPKKDRTSNRSVAAILPSVVTNQENASTHQLLDLKQRLLPLHWGIERLLMPLLNLHYNRVLELSGTVPVGVGPHPLG